MDEGIGSAMVFLFSKKKSPICFVALMLGYEFQFLGNCFALIVSISLSGISNLSKQKPVGAMDAGKCARISSIDNATDCEV